MRIDRGSALAPAELTTALSGRYTIERALGRGGAAIVYLACDLRHHRSVALKVFQPDLADSIGAQRFLQEIETVARLRHPHILPLYDSGEVNGVPYFVMPYVEGESLRARLERAPRLTVTEAVQIARAVADALDFAHRHGVIHRDIKPENILLEAGHAIVADFGIARAVSAAWGDSVTRTGYAVGTPGYVSPEQASGERDIDGRSDLYSLACVLYEMLAGEPPFTGATAHEVIAKRFVGSFTALRVIRPDVPAEVADAVARALAPAPSDRFSSAAAFAEALTTGVSIEHGGLGREHAATSRFVAVLPFDNLTSDPENEYFSDGITDDIIAQLSKIAGLRVISRASAMRYKRSPKSLREIAADLGVSYVLEGSVRRADKRVRIVAELIDGRTDEHVWTDTYDRELTDIFSIQSDVALQIANALQAELSPEEEVRIGKPPTRDLDAYELYLRGRQCEYKFTEEWIRRGLEYFERAIAKDPHYARAYAGVAHTYVVLGLGHGAGTLRSSEAYAKARLAVESALALDAGLGEAHGVLAFLKFIADYDWTGAEREYQRAIELNPGSAEIYDSYGLLLSSLGRFDEAIAAQKHAQELDPLTTVASSDLASALLRAGRYDDAAKEAQRLIQLEPGFPMGHSTLGWAYVKLGKCDDGLRELEHAVAISPANTLFLAQLGQAYAETGKVQQAREILGRLEELAKQRYVSPYHMAYVYTGLSEPDEAIDWLERAYEERAGGVYGIKGSFLFRSLQPHARFQALLRKMNLA
ncbi:MAG TPA: protein kinase [Gemmatimonadaceae bacterium]|nr:protein kinase [Gemmatimonadaceae bacterium]